MANEQLSLFNVSSACEMENVINSLSRKANSVLADPIKWTTASKYYKGNVERNTALSIIRIAARAKTYGINLGKAVVGTLEMLERGELK